MGYIMINPDCTLKDDLNLLGAMLEDMQHQLPLYRPGPYWMNTASLAAKEIRTKGLGDFRGSSNLIGQGFTDNLPLDRRQDLRSGFVKRLFGWVVTNIFPLNRIYQNQVNLTSFYAKQSISYLPEVLKQKRRTAYLLANYNIPFSLLGGCVVKAIIDQDEIAVHYLAILDKHDHASKIVSFGKARTLFEIGGGFGVNIHLVLTNYKNIRKVIYLDIPPNLYVGTQYLKSFFGTAVVDYEAIKKRNSLEFSNDDRLEILCIAPWQVELLKSEVDIFYNSASFVEMPKNVVQNYADKVINQFESGNTAVIVDSYSCFDSQTTLSPDELPRFFSKRTDFVKFDGETLMPNQYSNVYYISPGKFGNSSSQSTGE